MTPEQLLEKLNVSIVSNEPVDLRLTPELAAVIVMAVKERETYGRALHAVEVMLSAARDQRNNGTGAWYGPKEPGGRARFASVHLDVSYFERLAQALQQRPINDDSVPRWQTEQGNDPPWYSQGWGTGTMRPR